MSRGTKIVLIALAICASASVLMAAAGAVFVYQDGVIDVLVQEKSEDGTTIHLIVPMTLARVALAFVPFESGLDACPDAQRYWPMGPGLSGAPKLRWMCRSAKRHLPSSPRT